MRSLRNLVLNPERILQFRGYTFSSRFLIFCRNPSSKLNGKLIRILMNPLLNPERILQFRGYTLFSGFFISCRNPSSKINGKRIRILMNPVLNPERILQFRGYTFSSRFFISCRNPSSKINGKLIRILMNPVLNPERILQFRGYTLFSGFLESSGKKHESLQDPGQICPGSFPETSKISPRDTTVFFPYTVVNDRVLIKYGTNMSGFTFFPLPRPYIIVFICENKMI
jgi:hypothetical protein